MPWSWGHEDYPEEIVSEEAQPWSWALGRNLAHQSAEQPLPSIRCKWSAMHNLPAQHLELMDEICTFDRQWGWAWASLQVRKAPTLQQQVHAPGSKRN